MTSDPLDLDALRASCSRFLTMHGRRSAAEQLADITQADGDVEPDVYGAGGVVTKLESEVAELLGFDAAVFLPSGVMAQQIALRLHVERTGRSVVGWHPTTHLVLHELDALSRLHGVNGRAIGDARRLFTADDIADVAEPLAAVLFELPQREIGGQLPDWDDLLAQIAIVRERGAGVHLDGARIWEAAAGYGRTPREVGELFDTVYVSFYKGLGGLAGCCLVGDEATIQQAREWRTRHGGTIVALWPYAAAARTGLRLRLPRMPAYLEHARAIAAALGDVHGVEVVPDPPHVPMMHLELAGEAAALEAELHALASDSGIWTWRRTFPTDSPHRQRVELAVGDATLEWAPGEAAELLDAVVRRAAGGMLPPLEQHRSKGNE